jgi:hypothetical protein
MASQYAFVAGLQFRVDGDDVRTVEDLRGDVLRRRLSAPEVDVGVPLAGDLRTLIGETHRAATVECQHVVLAGLRVPQAIISMSFARLRGEISVSAGSTST